MFIYDAIQSQDQHASDGDQALCLVLQSYPHMHQSKVATLLEHLRLQLHIARARIPHPHPWALDPRDPVTQNLVCMYRILYKSSESSH